METLECKCQNCQQPLARFFDLWTRLGENYFSPVLDAIGEVQITTRDPMRVGKPHTLVAECEIQDIACIGCKAVIGVKCLSSPINHVLEDSQIFLRQTSVQFFESNGGTAKLKIRRTLRLQDCSGSKPEQTEPTFHESQRHDSDFDDNDDDDGGSLESGSIDLVDIQADLEAQRKDIKRIDTAAYQAVFEYNDTITRIDSQVKKLNASTDELRSEINDSKRDLATAKADISEVKLAVHQRSATAKFENSLQEACLAITNLEKLCEKTRNKTDALRGDLQITKDDVQRLKSTSPSLRQELAIAKKAARDSLSAAKENIKELAKLRAELKQVKEGVGQQNSQLYESKAQSLMPRELDILSTNITKIGNRASLVDSLQMEMDLLKSRLQRLEANVESSAQRNHEYSLKLPHPEGYSKRFETAEDPRGNMTPAKPGEDQDANPSDEKGASSTARPHPRTRKRKTPSERSDPAYSLRLTKSGAVDKRTIKKQKQNCSVDAPI